MNVHDHAHDLGKALRNSEEYKEWQQTKAEVEADKHSFEMLVDFRKEQMEYQAQKMSGVDTKEREEKLRKMFEVLNLNESIRKFLYCEHRFAQLMTDIQKILSEVIEGDTKA